MVLAEGRPARHQTSKADGINNNPSTKGDMDTMQSRPHYFILSQK